MTTELTYLAAVTLFTALMWIPLMANIAGVRGLKDAAGYPDNPKSLAPWAIRVDRAHKNAIENLIVFAPLVLIAHSAGISNEVTILACTVYFWVRVAHFFLLTFAVPLIKSISFVIGFVCQILLAWQILA